jgi:tyrosyl-tRNA synthetase
MPIFSPLPAIAIRRLRRTGNGARHPRDVKMGWHARSSIFHNDAAAVEAEEHFKHVFQERELPEEMRELVTVRPCALCGRTG